MSDSDFLVCSCVAAIHQFCEVFTNTDYISDHTLVQSFDWNVADKDQLRHALKMPLHVHQSVQCFSVIQQVQNLQSGLLENTEKRNFTHLCLKIAENPQ